MFVKLCPCVSKEAPIIGRQRISLGTMTENIEAVAFEDVHEDSMGCYENY